MYNELIPFLRDMAGDRVRVQEPMKEHTSFRIGGPADVWFSPKTEEEIRLAYAKARELKVPVTVLGNGSNLVVSDLGIEGLVLQIGEDFSCVQVRENRIAAQSGAKLVAVCRKAQQAGLSGLEFAYGIPACVGGAVTMDAGAYGGEMAQVTACVRLMNGKGEFLTLTGEEMHFAYRHSRVMEEELIILGAEFALTQDDPAAILSRMEDYNSRRREKQPLNYPSAGSVFKRPEGHFAGKLIEDAGLKGARVGDAQVSEKHAGFIVNLGHATAQDVMTLMDEVRRKVHDASGVMLEPELRLIGRREK